MEMKACQSAHLPRCQCNRGLPTQPTPVQSTKAPRARAPHAAPRLAPRSERTVALQAPKQRRTARWVTTAAGAATECTRRWWVGVGVGASRKDEGREVWHEV
eukprot:365796-Chlamydomonas_euryale.AAC.5